MGSSSIPAASWIASLTRMPSLFQLLYYSCSAMERVAAMESRPRGGACVVVGERFLQWFRERADANRRRALVAVVAYGFFAGLIFCRRRDRSRATAPMTDALGRLKTLPPSMLATVGGEASLHDMNFASVGLRRVAPTCPSDAFRCGVDLTGHGRLARLG